MKIHIKIGIAVFANRKKFIQRESLKIVLFEKVLSTADILEYTSFLTGSFAIGDIHLNCENNEFNVKERCMEMVCSYWVQPSVVDLKRFLFSEEEVRELDIRTPFMHLTNTQFKKISKLFEKEEFTYRLLEEEDEDGVEIPEPIKEVEPTSTVH